MWKPATLGADGWFGRFGWAVLGKNLRLSRCLPRCFPRCFPIGVFLGVFWDLECCRGMVRNWRGFGRLWISFSIV